MDVGLELTDNVVITRRMWPEGMRSVDDMVRNLRGGSGFYDYLAWQVYSQKDRVGEFAGDCTFYRYRSDDLTLMPSAGLTEQQMWERLRKTTGERGIEPLDRIRTTAAKSCWTNHFTGRSADYSPKPVPERKRSKKRNSISKRTCSIRPAQDSRYNQPKKYRL